MSNYLLSNAWASPVILAAYTGGTSNGVLPSLQLYGSSGAGANVAALTLPSLLLSAQGGDTADLELPPLQLGATGTAVVSVAAQLTLPSLALSANGTGCTVAKGVMNLPALSLIGYTGAVCSVTLNNGYTLSAYGTTGSTGYVAATLPMFDIVAAVTARGLTHAELILPSLASGSSVAWVMAPSALLVAIGTAVVAVTYEAYALNLKHNPTPGVEPVDELTHYTNYPFDRIVRYKNSYFGMNSVGLFLLEGTTDVATPIVWAYKTAMTDFKSVQNKNVSMVYFGGRMGPAATVSVYVGEASTAPYTYTTPRDATAQNYRQPLGKGLKARYYAFGATGGGELSLDSLSLNVATLARKV